MTLNDAEAVRTQVNASILRCLHGLSLPALPCLALLFR
jgi:hypothetical protein